VLSRFLNNVSTLVRPNNLAGIFVVLVLIASISFILLPVGLELGVEITRNAETSTAVLWTGGNAVSFLWVLGEPLLYLLTMPSY
jgi:hypothetical protein